MYPKPVPWKPAETAPRSKWLITRRDGWVGVSVASTDGEHWFDRKGQTLSPQTHWLVEVPDVDP